MKPARRTDWGILMPLPEEHAALSISHRFTEAEMEKIRLGHIPQQMEDRWFVFFEDDVLYFHRSWTGFCIYTARFARTDEGYQITHLLVNRNPEQYRGSDPDEDAALFQELLDYLLLSRAP